jgi:undecaprenyl-diphosphatase
MARNESYFSPPVVAGLALFAGISLLMVTGVTQEWDNQVLLWIGVQRSEGLTTFMQLATFLGDGALEIPFALAMCGVLWWIAGRRSATALFAGALSGELIYVIAKASFQRDRPDLIERLSSAGWTSYPSGHAMLAPIIWSLALLLLVPYLPRMVGRFLVVMAIAIPISIAASRVYLGVHYPSDVLGALALGAAWMSLWLVWSRSAVTSSAAL